MVHKDEAWVRAKVKDDPEMYNSVELRAAQLGCWCAHENCHSDVLVGLCEQMFGVGSWSWEK